MFTKLFYAGVAVVLMAACKQNAPAKAALKAQGSPSCLETDTAKSINTQIYLVSTAFGLPTGQSNSCYPIAADAQTPAQFEIKVDTTHALKTPFTCVRWFPTDLASNLKYFDLNITPSTTPGRVNAVLTRSKTPIPAGATNTEFRVTIIGSMNADTTNLSPTEPKPTPPYQSASVAKK